MRSRKTDLILAKMLRSERLRAEFTQSQLANALGSPQSLIAKLENGERRLLLTDAIAISRTLGFDLGKFCDEAAVALER